jgi:hypothetical protein
MTQCRADGKNTFCLDESWIDNNVTQKKGDVKANNGWNASESLITVHTGSRNGFTGKGLLILKDGKATGDYHGT